MMMGGGLLVGLVLMMLFLVLLAGAIGVSVWIARQGSDGSGQGSRQGAYGQDAALEILRQRYARGEIDQEEFHQMRDEIRS